MSVSSQLPCESLASELYRIYHTAEIPHRKHIRFNKRPRRFNSGRSILCNGKAEFYDCEFLCNVAQTDSYITVSSSGEIHFNRCTFKKGFHSGLFLIGNSGCRISFTGCYFIGCNNFAQMNDCAEVTFNNCQFQDCTLAVVQASFLPESHFEFENNIWRVAASPKSQSLKLLLKILVAPVILLLTVAIWICVGIIYISALALGLISMVVALLGVAVLITYSPQNGIILLVMAFLISPYGLPMTAIWLLSKVQNFQHLLQSIIYRWSDLFDLFLAK